MSSDQRLIKYFAIAFAAFLAIMIISIIASVISMVIGIMPGAHVRSGGGWNRNTSDISKDFDNVTSLEIDNAIGEFRIKTGEDFLVEAENVNDDFTALVDSDGTLKIKDSKDGFHFPFINFGSPNSKIVLYLPEAFIAEKADIEAGAGNIIIESLQAEDLYISAGIGNLEGDNITAQRVDIEGGVGNVDLNNVNFTNAVLESGVGKLRVDGTLLGKTNISCGVGQVSLNLSGKPSEYGFIIDSGIGSIKLNGDKVSGEYRNNTEAPNVIDVDGGVGKVDIDIEE